VQALFSSNYSDVKAFFSSDIDDIEPSHALRMTIGSGSMGPDLGRG